MEMHAVYHGLVLLHESKCQVMFFQRYHGIFADNTAEIFINLCGKKKVRPLPNIIFMHSL